MNGRRSGPGPPTHCTGSTWSNPHASHPAAAAGAVSARTPARTSQSRSAAGHPVTAASGRNGSSHSAAARRSVSARPVPAFAVVVIEDPPPPQASLPNAR